MLLQVLENVSRCYCVVLHAVLDMHDSTADLQQADLGADMAARLSSQATLNANSTSSGHTQHQQPSPVQQQHGTSTSAAATQQADAPDAPAPSLPARHSSTDESSGAWQIGTHKRTLFAGYVSFQQVQDFIESSNRNGRSLLDGWLKAPKAPQKDKVVMTGPGGMGRCEVAVTKLEAPAAAGAASSSGSSLASQPQGTGGPSQQQGQEVQGAAQQQQQTQGVGAGQGLLQRGLQRARVVASGVQQALDVLSELQPGPAASHMLCALMTLRLPVHFLAQELLAAV